MEPLSANKDVALDEPLVADPGPWQAIHLNLPVAVVLKQTTVRGIAELGSKVWWHMFSAETSRLRSYWRVEYDMAGKDAATQQNYEHSVATFVRWKNVMAYVVTANGDLAGIPSTIFAAGAQRFEPVITRERRWWGGAKTTHDEPEPEQLLAVSVYHGDPGVERYGEIEWRSPKEIGSMWFNKTWLPEKRWRRSLTKEEVEIARKVPAHLYPWFD